MIKKEFKKLIGIKKEEFDAFIADGQIQLNKPTLIPTLKTGDEGALTSIFLSSLRLIKEYRDAVFKEIKLIRSGKAYFYREVCFSGDNDARIDGLVIVVVKNVIVDAVFFEMKNKNNEIEKPQIEKYLELLKQLKGTKMVTVSNQFVADPSHSPIQVKVPKSIELLHFSWTYLITKAQLLLFENNQNIQDEDQVEIMREVLCYFESPSSGISGYTQMKPGWKVVSEFISAQKPIKVSDECVREAVLSWCEQEKDMALLLSRKLGVLVKSSSKNKDSIKKDMSDLVKVNHLLGSLAVKNSVSDINIQVEFERKNMIMSVKVKPPMDKGTVAKISWIAKQLENSKKKSEEVFAKIEKNLWVEVNIKYAKANIKVKLLNLSNLSEECKGKDIQNFHIVLNESFGAGFSSVKKFISLSDKMVLNFYEGIVQHMTNWSSPAPKLV